MVSSKDILEQMGDRRQGPFLNFFKRRQNLDRLFWVPRLSRVPTVIKSARMFLFSEITPIPSLVAIQSKTRKSFLWDLFLEGAFWHWLSWKTMGFYFSYLILWSFIKITLSTVKILKRSTCNDVTRGDYDTCVVQYYSSRCSFKIAFFELRLSSIHPFNYALKNASRVKLDSLMTDTFA
jgi:hypothetical protein